MFIQDSDVTVNDSRIIGNTSNTGVGIFIENNSDHTVTMKDNTVITENAGAGIYAYSANGHLDLNLDGVTIKDNTATENRSGGIIAYIIDSGSLTLDLDGVTIKENGTSDACSVVVQSDNGSGTPKVVLSGVCDIDGIKGDYNGTTISDPIIQVESDFALSDTESPIHLTLDADYETGTVLIGGSATPEMFSPDSGMVLRSTTGGLAVYDAYKVSFVGWDESDRDETQVVANETIPSGDYPAFTRGGFKLSGWETSEGDAWSSDSPVTESITLVALWEPIDPSLNITATVDGSSLRLVAGYGTTYEGAQVSFLWEDGTKGDTLVVSQKDQYEVTMTIESDGETWTFTQTYDYSNGHTVSFVKEDGSVFTQLYVPDGGSLDESQYPNVPAKDGYIGNWNDESLDMSNITGDLTVEIAWILIPPTISVSVSGTLYEGGSITATVTFDHPIGDDLTATFLYGLESGDSEIGQNSTGVFIISGPGVYLFAVIVTDADGLVNYNTTTLEVVEHSRVDPPFVPGDDDDYVPIPPVIIDESSSDDDDAVKVAACAAATAAAAIIALILVAEYRKR